MMRTRIGSLQLTSVLIILALVLVRVALGATAIDEEKQAWGKAVAGQAISITTKKATFSSREVIVLTIAFKNVGQEKVRVARTFPLSLYDVTVLLPDGKEAPHTLYGKRMLEGGMGAYLSIRLLKPGEQVSDEIEISRIFDMSLDGKYTVSVRRKVWKGGTIDKTLKATSNKVEIVVK